MSEPVTLDSPAVQNHLQLLQGIISRVAGNSAQCKTWSMALVSAILLVVLERNRPELLVVALLPVLLFFFLDAYYLSVERQLRRSFAHFTERLHEGTLYISDLFVFQANVSRRRQLNQIGEAAFSLAVWPFYVLLVALLYLVGLRLTV